MARRNEEYARLKPGGGYTQALAVGKGFSGAERSTVKRGGVGSRRGGGEGGGSGSGGTMNAYAQHQQLIRNYHRYHLNAKVPSSGAIEAKGLPGQRRLTDEEALQRQHRFVRDNKEDNRAHQARGLEGAEADPSAWEVRMAAKYYKLLFKEYALADLSRYREDKVGLRWRTEKDVVSGKGQFECGALRCQERKDLHSYELNFKYKEAGEIKNELVKVRVCPQCARKLFRKKIEALQRQREAQARSAKEETADKERRRKTAKKSPLGSKSPPSPSHGSASDSDNRAAEGSAGSPDAAGRVDRDASGDRLGGQTDAGKGHDFVLQAVGGLSEGGGKAADGRTVARKRSRPSRWGDRIIPPEGRVAEAAGGTVKAAAGQGDTGGASGGGLAPATGSAAAIGGEASRKAWAGELERDRTAEDEMDDYLSSLLL